MKTTTIITLLALAGSGLALAQDENTERPERPERPSPEERREMAQKRREAMLEKYDTDKDGKLSEEERAVLNEDRKKRRAELLEKYDADGNGKLDREEIKAARDAGEKIPMRGGMGRRGPGGKPGPNGPGPKGPRGPQAGGE